jgi:hypothetical protein
MTRCGLTISRYLSAPQYSEIRKQGRTILILVSLVPVMKATTGGFERMTKVWNRIVVDRTVEMTSWVDVCKKIQRRGATIYGYFNNHYAGFGPASVQLFRDTCIKNGLEIPPVAPPPVVERTSFD